jgi:cystathionine beta-synthase
MNNVKVIGVDCVGSILAHYHKTGEMSEAHSYVLEGIGEDFIPGNINFDIIDDFLIIEDEPTIQFTRKLLKEEAIYTGGSAAGSVMAAIKYAEKLDKPEKILVLLHDHGNRYSGKIYNDAWMKKMGYAVNDSQDNLDKEILEIINGNGRLV